MVCEHQQLERTEHVVSRPTEPPRVGRSLGPEQPTHLQPSVPAAIHEAPLVSGRGAVKLA